MGDLGAFQHLPHRQVPLLNHRKLDIFERTRRHLERRGWSKFTFLTLDGRVSLLQALADVFNTPEELQGCTAGWRRSWAHEPCRRCPPMALHEFNKYAETAEIDVLMLLRRAEQRA